MRYEKGGKDFSLKKIREGRLKFQTNLFITIQYGFPIISWAKNKDSSFKSSFLYVVIYFNAFIVWYYGSDTFEQTPNLFFLYQITYFQLNEQIFVREYGLNTYTFTSQLFSDLF